MSEGIPVVEISPIAGPTVMGTALAVVLALAAIVVLAIFICGVVRKLRKRDYSIQSWWLRHLTIWLVLLGFMNYAVFWAKQYALLSLGGVGNPELVYVNHNEAFGRLASISVMAFATWTLGLLLGPTKPERREQ